MPAKYTLLLVEDDEHLGFMLKDNLEMAGYKVRLCRDGEKGLTAFHNDAYQLCILDVMLPLKDGFSRNSALEKFRSEYENVFGVYIFQNQEPEVVRIECTRFQSKYLKSLPLHPSQETESENEEVTIFRYKLRINHEFAYELLRQNVWNFNPGMLEFPHPHRPAIKVLEPAWLVDYFHQTYKRSFLMYNDDGTITEKIKKEIDESNPYPLAEF